MAILLTVVAIVLALIWAGQRRMIYFPIGGTADLRTSGLANAEPVTFHTDDGLTLQAWFVRPSSAATAPPAGLPAMPDPPAAPARLPAIIVFNGNAGHRGFRARLAEAFGARGWACLLVDYRGFGGNPGSPTEDGLTRDARAARAYLATRADVDPARLVYFGESLGAAVAARLAVDSPPAALVLRSPFTSLAEVGQRHYPFLPVRWLLRDRFPVADLVGRVRAPVLVIAGTADGIVPIDHSRRVFAAAPEPKQFIEIYGADHNDEALVHGEVMIRAIAQFLAARR